MGSGEVADPRQETAEQRNDRNLGELVQELRVAGLGVQVLFGFLLSLPFSNRFGQLSDAQSDLYLTCVILSAVATILLVGPVAYHRLVFRRGMKEELVRFANLLAILGLTAVGGAVLAAVLLVTWFVAGAVAGALITAVIGVMVGGLWFGVPLVSRRGTARLSVSTERLIPGAGQTWTAPVWPVAAAELLVPDRPALAGRRLHHPVAGPGGRPALPGPHHHGLADLPGQVGADPAPAAVARGLVA
ncbi:MAG TPA: DUF6328 family protein [Trebonia sp.]